LRVISGEHGPRANYCGRSLIMMSSNNYLGLAADPRVKNAAISAVARYGVGAGASRLIAGSLEPLHRLEARLARFKAPKPRWCSAPDTSPILGR
jgi:7-keto-8-aminopelargonate synthetase-like enzyme